MNRWIDRVSALAASAACAGLFCALCAHPATARADAAPGVARMSVVSGSVTLKRGDSGDSIAAAPNAPVNVGDYVMTNDNALAEVQLDGSDYVRVSSGAQLRFTNLGNPDQVQLAQGTIELRSLQPSVGNPSVQTPSATVRPDSAGRYRLDVTDSGDTLLAVRSGTADIVGPQGTQTITAGTTVSISGSSSDPQITRVANLGDDSFDEWNSQRDQYLAAVSNDPYEDTGMVGLADLDTYGRWVSYPQYGQVWVANTYPVGWAPYQSGRWAWEPYYGWTWVGYEPWGWAPYHYGRWFWSSGLGWAWYPGPAYVRPVYQPALVGFFGFGGGGGLALNFRFGNVGWVPLAPYEAYHPWWGPGFATRTTIVYNYNVTNYYSTANITRVYRNASVPGGVAVVSHQNFTNGGAYHYVQVHSSDLNSATLVRGPLPVVPTRQNLSFTKSDGAHVTAATPLSSRFAGLPTPVKLPPTFAQERANVQTVAQHFSTTSTTNTTTHTAGSPWDRFNSNGPNGNPAAGGGAGQTNGHNSTTNGTSTAGGSKNTNSGSSKNTNSGGSKNKKNNSSTGKGSSKPQGGGNGSGNSGQGHNGNASQRHTGSGGNQLND